MVTYKEFEVIRTLLKPENLSQDIVEMILDNTYHQVFRSREEVTTLVDSLEKKGYIAHGKVTQKAMEEIEPCRVENAVILAAGGFDISEKSVYSSPKGLYIKNGEPLIERQICQLREAGIQDIIVVVGYKQEMYFYLADKYGVTLKVNSDFRKNNILSLYVVIDNLSNTYICNCDNYFAKNPFSQYEYNAYHATVVKNNTKKELLVHKNESGRITEVYSGDITGECVYGHAYIDKKFARRLKRYMKEEIEEFRVSNMFWEEFVSRHIRNLDMYVREYSPDFLYEFDSIQEIQNIDSLFLENVSGRINQKICEVLKCKEEDIRNIDILQKGLTNVLFTFVVRGNKYIFRYPGESSSSIVYRDREVCAQKLAAKAGVDNTYVYIDGNGIKISKFVEKIKDLHEIYYNDIEFMKELARKIRLFHDAGKEIDAYGEFRNNPITESDRLMKEASHMKGNLFEMFAKDRENIIRLFQYAEQDGIPKTMCHNDINGDNCLLTDLSFDIIDWEFAGFNDPAYDFGRVIAGYNFDSPEIDAILEAYFGRKATDIERLHWIAYVGIHNWYYFNWALYKESINESSRDWMLFFYNKVKEVICYAIPKYEEIYR